MLAFVARRRRCKVAAMDPTDANVRSAAATFTHRLAEIAGHDLGPQLIGFYLIGSLAHGGFNARYSDIDIALIVQQPLTPGALDRLRQRSVEISAELAARLSIFWSDESFSSGRFPPLDRIDTLDHGIALYERRRVMPPRPSLIEVRDYLAGPPFENWAQDAARLSAQAHLGDSERKRYLRALLYPARFLYSWQTGRICSNDEAVAFLQWERPSDLDIGLIVRALECRNADSDPDELFIERSKLSGLVKACKRLTIDAHRR